MRSLRRRYGSQHNRRRDTFFIFFSAIIIIIPIKWVYAFQSGISPYKKPIMNRFFLFLLKKKSSSSQFCAKIRELFKLYIRYNNVFLQCFSKNYKLLDYETPFGVKWFKYGYIMFKDYMRNIRYQIGTRLFSVCGLYFIYLLFIHYIKIAYYWRFDYLMYRVEC